MGLFDKLKQIKKQKSKNVFRHSFEADGIQFSVSPKAWQALTKQQVNAHLMHQYVALQMLVEEGMATQIQNGFFLPSTSAVLLDSHTRFLLDLPDPWLGSLHIEIDGHTQSQRFNVMLFLETSDGESIRYYDFNGPILTLSEEEKFLPDATQWHAFQSVKSHGSLPENERSEYHNLKLIYQLQQAKEKGLNIDLSHFSELNIVQPERIGVTVDEQGDGSAILTPSFGNLASADDIASRLGQLDPNHHVQSMRINDSIVLLDEEKLACVHEIIHKRKIPKSHVRQFMETPGAYLDASQIDLDIGFSYRVKGATRFKHAYFGDTDLSDINWFSKDNDTSETASENIPDLTKIITDQSDLEQFRHHMTDSIEAGADCFEFNQFSIPLDQIKIIEDKLNELATTLTESSQESVSELKVIDITQNDEFCEFANDKIPPQPESCLYREPLDFSRYKRQPYPHQL